MTTLPLYVLVLALMIPQIGFAAPPQGKGKPAKQVSNAERKLDKELRGRAATQSGESDVIVEFHDNADDADVIAGFGNAGRRLKSVKGRVLRIPNALLARLAENKRVKRIHFDRPVAGEVARTAITIGSRAVVRKMGYTGAGIGVAVIDSGITNWHDDLQIKSFGSVQPTLLDLAQVSYAATGQVLPRNQRVAHFKDFVNGYTTPYDDWGHGTHVSGIIAGNGFDTLGIREGIAPGSHIVSLKALARDGSGSISNVIAAIDYAIANKDAFNIRVINMSLSAGVFESYHTDPLTIAAKRAVEAGIVVVASAGNYGKAADGSPQYGAIGAPGNAPWVLTVGASSTEGTTKRADDVVAKYSSRGPTMFDYAAKPDLVAPGTGTISLSDPLSRLYTEKSSFLSSGFIWGLSTKPYLTLTGTSMAAPVVSGTIALMLHANPSLTPNMVKAILQFTSEVYDGNDFLTQGAGFLDAKSAVVLAEYFRNGRPGDAYPTMDGWSRHILWGNYRVSGGVLAPGGTAWGTDIVWGDTHTPAGQNIVWGENCDTADCSNIVWGSNLVWGNLLDSSDNIVWGNTDADNIVWGQGDNIVWGNGDLDNIVWGNLLDNIVWGNDCGGEDCDNIVWGQDVDNIVWGNAEGIDNIVWGNIDLDNIVWGNTDGDNIVWGNSAEDAPFVDDTAEVEAFDAAGWEELFATDTSLTTSSTDTTTTETSTTTGLLSGGIQ